MASLKSIIRLLPSFVAFAWVLWYCVQAKWSEVIAPNWQWLVLADIAATILVVWLQMVFHPTPQSIETRMAIRASGKSAGEELVAREVYTWKTVTREREIYRRSSNANNLR